MTEPPNATPDGLLYSLLDGPLIGYRHMADGRRVKASLPELFVAMAKNEVRDFPALRPHQRHPWHAFLCQVAAIALHHADLTELLPTADAWRQALLALTPNDMDGAAWCLISPLDRPALLQPPVPGGSVVGWKNDCRAADRLDMLVTSKNHDLKRHRSRDASAEQWFFALLSLQTQQGSLGSGNYGVSRMNKGYGSRPGIGVAVVGDWGLRWQRDVTTLRYERDDIASKHGLTSSQGHALVWLLPWDGATSLSFSRLDPLYIEVCRRVRIRCDESGLYAVNTGTKVPRIAADQRNGITGDAWTPIDIAEGKALSITRSGFDYKLVSKLLFGGEYVVPLTQHVNVGSSETKLQFIALGVARSQGGTEGYHERRVPISPKLRRLLTGQRDQAARMSSERIAAIGEVRKLLWLALMTLFNGGSTGNDASDGTKHKAGEFTRPFELREDARFFIDLTAEVEADDTHAERLNWLIGLVERAEKTLTRAFDAGPRNGMQRYRARAAALSRFHGVLRGTKSPLPMLAQHYQDSLKSRH